MRGRLIYIVFVLLVAGTRISAGQDPQFTQFYAAPLYLSPSFAGSSGSTRLIMNFRDQWPKLQGDFVTYALSLDHYLEKYSSGVGLLFFRDQAGGGLVNTTNIGINYSYNFKITRKWHLSPGIQVYYYVKNINYNKLLFSDQITRDYISSTSIEMERLSTIKSVQHLDVTTSLLAYSEKYWGGFTFDHMLSLNNTLRTERGYLPLRLSVYGGGKYYMSGRIRRQKEKSVTGAFNFTYQDRYKYLDLGAYYTQTPMLFGIWYRGLPVFSDNKNIGALTLQVGYNAKAFMIGYSYDYTVSRLMTRTGGAHEVSIAFELQSVQRKKKMRAIPCPSFL